MDKDRGNHFLDIFFYPKSVAIVGASTNPATINYNILWNLKNLKFPGRIYPVNPKASEILGHRSYPDVRELPEPPELAVIAVPYTAVPAVFQDCLEKGVKAVVIIAGGFSESGSDGKKAQDEIARRARGARVRVLGPNALSPINARYPFAVSFHRLPSLKKGELSFIFQSGLYEPRLRWLFKDFNLHLDKLIDLGNKMDIDEVEALEYLSHDSGSTVIGIHLENIEGNGRRFFELIRETAASKHVVVLKSGRTPEGQRAAASHTGAIVQGSDLVFDAALRQAGALRVRSIEEFFELAKALERFGGSTLAGNRIALATLPGGEGVVLTDLCRLEGLALAVPSEETAQRLQEVFPPWQAGINPFDLGVCVQFHPPMKVYKSFLEAMTKDPNVDGILLQLSPLALRMPKEMLDEAFTPIKSRTDKPLAIWLPGISARAGPLLEWLEEVRIPVFSSGESAIKALAALYRSSTVKRKREAPS